MSSVFHHDGSIDGLLCALSHAVRHDRDASIRGPHPHDVFGLWTSAELPDRNVQIEAEAFLNEVRHRLGPSWVRRILRLCCVDDRNIETLLCDLLVLAWKRGADVEHWHTNPIVRTSLRLERRVALEAHRFQGLLRFRRLMKGRLWGPMEPDHDVMPLLVPFFRRRLGSEPWLIHDVRRSYGIGWEPGTHEFRLWTAREILAELADGLHPSETTYQNLWRAFYKSISIPARCSPAVQRRHMPRRYWHYLVEEPGIAPYQTSRSKQSNACRSSSHD